MRIAFFTDTYLPNVDGVVTALVNYRKFLEERGHEVYIFAPGTKKQREENTDKKVHYFSSIAFKPYPDYKIAKFPFFSATNILKELQPSVVHSHGIATTGIAAFQAAKKINVPVVASFHTLVSDATHYLSENEVLKKFFSDLAWSYLRWYYSNFEKVIAPSNFAAKILEKNGIKNIEVLPNGIDTKLFEKEVNREYVRKKYKINEPLVLFVGRVAKEKNLELIIEASQHVINKINKVKFMIVGKGPALEYYKDLTLKKGVSEYFIFTGYVEQEELISIYKSADVFVFPSLFDTQGLVVLEALAAGLPAVVQKESASAEFVLDNICGYHFSDVRDFADKIIYAIENREKLKDKAIERAKEFDIRKRTEELEKFYEKIIELKSRR